MRILHVIRNLETGGAERLALDLAECQTRMGHNVSVATVCLSEGPEIEMPGILQTRIMRIAGGKRKRAGYAAIAKTLRSVSPDIVHVHNTLALLRCALPCRLLGLPLVMTKHGPVFTEGIRGLFYRLPRCIACVSPEIQAALTGRHGGMRSKSAVIPNGVPVEPSDGPRDCADRSGPDPAPSGCSGIWVGRFVEEKGLNVLVEAVARFAAAHPERPLAVLLAGDGPLRNSIESMVDARGLRERIKFAGMRADVRGMLPAFDFFILPSLREGLPIALLEGAAAGLPAVVARTGGMTAVVADGISGWTVEPGDSRALAETLGRVAETPPARLRAMGREAAERVRRRFSIRLCADRYLALYERHVR